MHRDFASPGDVDGGGLALRGHSARWATASTGHRLCLQRRTSCRYTGGSCRSSLPDQPPSGSVCRHQCGLASITHSSWRDRVEWTRDADESSRSLPLAKLARRGRLSDCDCNIAVVGLDGSPLPRLVLDPEPGRAAPGLNRLFRSPMYPHQLCGARRSTQGAPTAGGALDSARTGRNLASARRRCKRPSSLERLRT